MTKRRRVGSVQGPGQVGGRSKRSASLLAAVVLSFSATGVEAFHFSTHSNATTMRSAALLAAVALSFSATGVNAFFGGGGAKASAVKVSPEAIAEAKTIYGNRFNAKKLQPKQRPFFADWGMPKRDIDGSEIGAIGKGGTLSEKSLFDIDEQRQVETFKEIAKLYGEENALNMVKNLPNILAFDRTNFAPALAAFGEIFGEEEAKMMCVRNPGLLAVSPKNAATSTDQTMQFSYIVSYTRPIGAAGLPSILGLLSIPAIEQITHVPIRASFFAALSGGSTAEAAAGLQNVASSLPLM